MATRLAEAPRVLPDGPSAEPRGPAWVETARMRRHQPIMCRSFTMAQGQDRMEQTKGDANQPTELEDKIVRGASDLASSASKTLKNVGVDTDVMTKAAKGQATELQKLIIDEISAHPFRALGIAAAVGFVVGIWNAR
jgi:ElaB/YqjD/DUF883 family membrane-anchored ribosome-binding protein